MKNTLISIIASLVNVFGFRGEEFHTTKEDWNFNAWLFGKKLPDYKFDLMDSMAKDFKVGPNNVEVITKEGIVVANNETDDIAFIPYDCLSDDFLRKVIMFVEFSVDFAMVQVEG